MTLNYEQLQLVDFAAVLNYILNDLKCSTRTLAHYAGYRSDTPMCRYLSGERRPGLGVRSKILFNILSQTGVDYNYVVNNLYEKHLETIVSGLKEGELL